MTGRLEHFGQTGDPRAWVRIANGLLDRIASGELQPHDLAPLVDDLRIDAGLAITPISRARAALDPRCPPGQYACALAGLAAASGLAFRRDPYRPAGRTVQDAVTSLAPAMQMLIHQTEVSVAVLSQRT